MQVNKCDARGVRKHGVLSEGSQLNTPFALLNHAIGEGAFTPTNSPCNRMSRNVRKEPMSVWVGMRSRLRMSGSNLKKGAVAGNESSPAFVTVRCDETGRIRTSARKRTGGLTVTDVREEFDHLKEQDEKARALSLRPTAPPIG